MQRLGKCWGNDFQIFYIRQTITVYGELELNEWERGDTKYKDFQLNVRGWNFVNFGQPQQQKEDSNGSF